MHMVEPVTHVLCIDLRILKSEHLLTPSESQLEERRQNSRETWEGHMGLVILVPNLPTYSLKIDEI